MLKVFIFGIVFFGCYFGSMEAITCLVNADPTMEPIERSGCNYCGYNRIYDPSKNVLCAGQKGILYSCLSTHEIIYGDERNGGSYSSNVPQCITNKANCLNYDLFICSTDKCNARCGIDPNAPQPKTYDSNKVSPTTLSFFGLCLSAFISFWFY